MTRWPALLLCFLFALAASSAPSPVLAQDDEGGGSSAGKDDDVVSTRAPVDKRATLVRNKFFYKRGRFEIAPQIGFLSSNALNNEILAGLALTYHVSDKFGVELSGNYALLGGAANTKQLALAVLRLLDPRERLESVDPGAFITLSAVFSPMYGKLNPFGAAVINLDFFFIAGIGYGNENIEMLNLGASDTGAEVAQLAIDAQLNHLFLLHLGFGAKVFVSKWFSLRLDARLYVTTDKVLNYDEETAANTNGNLGPLANRLSCDDATIDAQDIACRTTFPTTLVLGVGGSFWLPGDKVARTRMNRR